MCIHMHNKVGGKNQYISGTYMHTYKQHVCMQTKLYTNEQDNRKPVLLSSLKVFNHMAYAEASPKRWLIFCLS